MPTHTDLNEKDFIIPIILHKDTC